MPTAKEILNNIPRGLNMTYLSIFNILTGKLKIMQHDVECMSSQEWIETC